MKPISLLASILFFILLSCNSKKNNIESVRTIDFNSGNFTELENVLFDTLVSELEYVVLETTPENLVSNIGGITVTETEILIFGQTGIFVFNREGKFIRQLGSSGRGPEEYNSPLNVLFNDKTGIYTVDDYKHILQFNRECEFIRKLKKPDNLKRLYQFDSDYFIAERRVEPFFGDSIVYSLEFFDSEFNTILKHRSPEPSDPVEGHNFLIDLMGGISYWEKGLLFRETYGDTLYTISASMKVEPFLVLNFGSERWKREFNFNFGLYNENAEKYLIPGLSTYKDKHLISQFTLFGKSTYAITDIDKNKNYIPYNTESDKNGFVLSAFPGYNFRPVFIKGYLSYVIQAIDVITYFDPETETMPEELKKKISALGENDNPVLVLGKL